MRIVENSTYDIHEWYITDGRQYIWKDLKFHAGTGWTDISWTSLGRVPGDSLGYYATKAEAERYLRAYEVSQMNFGVYQGIVHPERGWFIATNVKYKPPRYVWLDLELHNTIGYYVNELSANITLERFKEKHMIKDNLEINVKLNGVDTPLHEISEQTLLRIREASKPKLVPVFQVCEARGNGSRLILKVTEQMAECAGQYVILNENGELVSRYIDMKTVINHTDGFYVNARELRLDRV